MTPPRIFVALPAFGSQCMAGTTASLFALAQQLAARGWSDGFSTLTFPDIAELRNIFLSIWYDLLPSSTHMLFVDADMEFRPELVLDQIALDKPLVGCLYPRKRSPISFVGEPITPDAQPINGFLPMRHIGGGLMLISRDMIVDMLAMMPELSDRNLERHTARQMLGDNGCHRIIRAFDKMETPEGVLSEDVSFCRRWEQCGGEIWAAINHEVAHIGPNAWRASYGSALAQRPEKIGVRFA